MKSQLRKHLWFSRMVFALSLGLLFLPTGCDPSTSATPSAVTSPFAPSSVSVAINPPTATVPEGGSLSFLATVKGVANTTVTWSVQEGTTGGSITSSGVYTAPNTLGTYHVVATSVADATASASAVVTIELPTSTAAGNFTAVGNMTVPRANSTATLLPDGRVLIVGGEQSGPSAELYNPATGTFQASSANMLGPPVVLNNGLVLDSGTAELYDPKTDSTTPTGHLLVDQGIYAATVLGNGKALVLGTHDAEIYDPVTGSFASQARTPPRWATFLRPRSRWRTAGSWSSAATRHSSLIRRPIPFPLQVRCPPLVFTAWISTRPRCLRMAGSSWPAAWVTGEPLPRCYTTPKLEHSPPPAP